MTINVKLNFQRFIDLVTLVSTFVLVSPKLLRPSFNASKSCRFTANQLSVRKF